MELYGKPQQCSTRHPLSLQVWLGDCQLTPIVLRNRGMRYLRIIATIPAALGPQLLWIAMLILFGDSHRIASDVSRYLVESGVMFGVWVTIVSSAFTWTQRRTLATSRAFFTIAVFSTLSSAVGVGVGFTFIIGLLSAYALFFFMSLPVLLLAIWNLRSAHNGCQLRMP